MNTKKLKSPAFIINQKKVNENIDEIIEHCKEISNDVIIGYSLKTNSISYLLKYLYKKGLYIEVVSFEEYNYALKIGIDRRKIIYNGVIKNKKTLLEAVKRECIVNIDSYTELQWLLNSNIKNREIGIRINLPIDNELQNCFEFPEEGSKFGFYIENNKLLEEYLQKLKKHKNITVSGLHLHCNTLNRTPIVYKKIIEYCGKILERKKINIKYLDIGGGYLGGRENNFSKYTTIINETLKKYVCFSETKIIIEPGAAIIATAASYFCKVIDVKNINNKNFITIDGSRIHFDPTFSNKKYHYTSNCTKKSKKNNIICGFTCMERDRIKLNENLELSVDDYLLFNSMGAYTMSFIPNFICSYPIVYWYNGKRIKVIKKQKKLGRFLK